MSAQLIDLSPLTRLVFLGVLFASGPLLLVYLRNRRSTPLGRLHALTVMTLFLTFDLVLFGAFTRLTDSGLGCPDWPGCYGSASPLGAGISIEAAQLSMPGGPVTPGKAWIEMVHRYLAMGVGVLITVLAVAAWLGRKSPLRSHASLSWWPALTLVWVCIQGAFGALTVTMKLFPAIVTLHLLGGYGLLALLTVQTAQLAPHNNRPDLGRIPDGMRRWIAWGLALLMFQAASGAWVSTNYAVLACTGFPTCQGAWWPLMDFAGGFEIWRPLGLGGDGAPISFQALTAIHFVHRVLAAVTLLCLGALTVALSRHVPQSQPVRILGALLLLQLATGLSNVVLGWPLVAAVLHTGGAGAMVVVMVWLLASTRSQISGLRPLSGPEGMGA
ncbi:MAG TPA: COX15/CtaA family protein [Rhodoferax sp.]|jgi:cytochrome c oxidase assembly protein subunit 15|nr:COX15/CtaA family protein [Rhodoferax sp.]HNV59996.1 COX15/CtaA family protein [Rhodoferax sp.]HPW29924.1 COX15/CtaA family protein [Rhodoferax sp.]